MDIGDRILFKILYSEIKEGYVLDIVKDYVKIKILNLSNNTFNINWYKISDITVLHIFDRK